ncbi:MAG: UDP-glucose 6-dehydrogenase [Bacteroidetes bacterium]|nr:MAG: UDP-glucose 6-dehydrogenase [Bacteroidota bacterium]
MNIVVVGTGYVGLVTGTCFAEVGMNVTCVDTNHTKIAHLKAGKIPIYEPGLEEMVQRNIQKGKLHFTVDLAETLPKAEIVFSAVGTPPDEDGSADLHYVLEVARTVGREMNHYMLIVTKSTVPVGTAEKIHHTIQQELLLRGKEIPFDVASNPEFLKEGSAVEDFLKPDRIVVGVNSEKAKTLFTRLYKPFTANGHPVIFMDIPSAEMTKYTANAMLATKISFMNDIANLCEKTGANINDVRRGIGSDTRIGNKFIYAGIGYGGSCFPKDVKAIIRTAREHDYEMRVLQAVEEVNNQQKSTLVTKAKHYFNHDLKGKKIALWGLSFKPQTDDMREAPSLEIIHKLLEEGAEITGYDPVAMEESKRIMGEKIDYATTMYDALDEADALILATEWKEFRAPDFKEVKKRMKNPVIFDGRNIYDREELIEQGFDYFGVGLQPHVKGH